MNLAERTRRAAHAKDPRTLALALMAFGASGLVAGAQNGNIPLAVAGAIVVGLVAGRLTGSTDRSYLEGFADGIAMAGPDEPRLAYRIPDDPAFVRGLPERPVADERARPDRRADPDQRGAGEPASRDPGGDPLATAFGVDIEPRLRTQPLDPSGDPVVAQGPRLGGFPAIPKAELIESPVRLPSRRSDSRRTRRIIETS